MLNHIFALPVERSPDIGEQSIKKELSGFSVLPADTGAS